VTRGGGSLQDLWCFNERVVAEAIRRTRVPVVSGVGHESDTSLSDLVADHRAHTPTDAAQTVIPDRREVEARLERAAGRLLEAVEDGLDARASRLAALARSRVLRDPSTLLTDRTAALGGVRARLSLAARRVLERGVERCSRARSVLERRAPGRRLDELDGRLRVAHRRLVGAANERVAKSDRRVALAARGLEAFSPLAVLGRGYSITLGADGKALRRAGDARAGDRLETRLAEGRVISRVEGMAPEGASSERLATDGKADDAPGSAPGADGT
jgi:exodeoxyribonuclease VII large subunit